MKLRAVGVAGILTLLGAQGAQAAQQCIGATGTTTYGGLSVTVGGTGCADYPTSPPFTSNLVVPAGGSCSVSFSSPVDTNSISVGVDSLDSSVLSAAVNGSAYVIQSADIVESPLTGAVYAPANPIVVSGGGVSANSGGGEGSGRFVIGSAAPATTTQFDLSQDTTGNSGTLLEICFDDAAVPVGPTAVPTLSEWAMILLSLLLAGGAAVYIQRRRSTLG